MFAASHDTLAQGRSLLGRSNNSETGGREFTRSVAEIENPPGSTPGGILHGAPSLLAGDCGGFRSPRYISYFAILPDPELVALRFLAGNGDLGARAADFHRHRLAVRTVEGDFFAFLEVG